jgi:hypothetical protein
MVKRAKPAAGDGGSRQHIGSGQNHAAETKATPDTTQAVLPIDPIIVGDRTRRNPGDVAGLATSIAEIGLSESDHPRRERTPAGWRSKARRVQAQGAMMKKRPFSLDIVGPGAGEYSASVVEVRTVERPDRLSAVITFALDSDPPFSVPDFFLLDAERQGTDTNRGRARIGQLIRIAGGDPKSISSPDDLQLLVGARVRVVIRVRERDGIQVPEIASILPPAEER